MPFERMSISGYSWDGDVCFGEGLLCGFCCFDLCFVTRKRFRIRLWRYGIANRWVKQVVEVDGDGNSVAAGEAVGHKRLDESLRCFCHAGYFRDSEASKA